MANSSDSTACGQQEDVACCGASPGGKPEKNDALAWFSQMIPHCLDYAQAESAKGRPIVGIMCEYTPRELIMAAGAIPVCLCGGSADTIPVAEEDLPVNLCPLIKSTYGYHRQGSNPFLEMAALIVAETTCDGKKKMYELMAQSRPMHVVELPQQQDSDAALAYWEEELHRLKRALEGQFNTVITEACLRDAIQVMNRERALRRNLATLMQKARPPITGLQLLTLKSSISGIGEDLAQYESAFEAWKEQEGDPELEKRCRVLLTGVPTAHGAERVVELIESQGGLLVCMENCTGLKPILEDVDADAADPMRAIAEKYYHLPCSVMTPNSKRLDSIRQLSKEYRVDCIIDLVWQACLTYDVESRAVKQLAEQELGLPFLHIETDYSPSDSQRIVVRVEALFETVQQRHGHAGVL